jgi:hypothetical protein
VFIYDSIGFTDDGRVVNMLIRTVSFVSSASLVISILSFDRCRDSFSIQYDNFFKFFLGVNSAL